MRKEGTVEKKVKKVTKIKQQQKGGTETLREATMAIEIKYDTLKTKIKEVKKKKETKNCVSQRSNVFRICVSSSTVDKTDPERSNRKRSMSRILEESKPDHHTKGKPSCRGRRISIMHLYD